MSIDERIAIVLSVLVITESGIDLYYMDKAKTYHNALVMAEEQYKAAIDWPKQCEHELQVCRDSLIFLLEGIKIQPPADKEGMIDGRFKRVSGSTGTREGDCTE